MKKAIKKLIFAIFYLAVLPAGLATIVVKKVFGSPALFHLFAEWFSLCPAHIGQYVRACYYYQTMPGCPSDLQIMFGSHLTKMDSVIGRNVVIAGHTTVGLVNLNDNCVIGSHVSILSGRRQHAFGEVQDDLFEGEDTFDRIDIGRSTFIGEGCMVMANVGEYSIVGAGSVVVKDIPDYVVAVGNPARVIKERPRVPQNRANH
jgi:acetyltransferase-like isoleucine patch superfamily enzyme